MERKEVIIKLNNLRNYYSIRQGGEENAQALDFAISSLLTDEAYQLEYERTTKNDLEADCISRQAVIDLMMQKWGENFSGDDAMQESIDAIRVLPSVTPQEPRWIPVSEKLPKPFTFVNATCRSLVDDREDWVVETVYLPIPKEANKHGYSDWGNIPILNWGEAEVIAWVERIIPQPYKSGIEPQESEE